MMRRPTARLLAYGFATLSTTAAFFLTVLLWPLIQPAVSPILLLSVLFSALYGGLGPGLLATALAGTFSAYFLMEPRYSVWVGFDDLLRLGEFAAVAIVVSSLMSARRRAEKQLRIAVRDQDALLRQRETLLKEIHHRVKNNFQIIASLLSLQEGRVQDAQVKDVFKESQNRVRTMALVHEKLYQTANLGEINFGDYLRGLTEQLARAYNAGHIQVRAETDDVLLELSAAVPCALLVNELVTNALEHAFPGHHHGEVIVEFRAHEIGRFTLIVRDTGVGLPHLDIERAQSLGLRLVLTFVEQLNGELKINRHSGTAFRIDFQSQRAGVPGVRA